MKYLLLVGVIFIINYTTGRGCYHQQRIHLTTLEVGEFCAKMLKSINSGNANYYSLYPPSNTPFYYSNFYCPLSSA